jgi:hypothetical protein
LLITILIIHKVLVLYIFLTLISLPFSLQFIGISLSAELLTDGKMKHLVAVPLLPATL